MRAVDRHRFFGVNEAAAFANPSRSNFVEPDRAKDCEQPAVDACSRDKLIGPLDRPQARRLDEIVSVSRVFDNMADTTRRTSDGSSPACISRRLARSWPRWSLPALERIAARARSATSNFSLAARRRGN